MVGCASPVEVLSSHVPLLAAKKAKRRSCGLLVLFFPLIAGGTGFEVFGQMLEGFQDLAGILDWI
jgi:hypothetical protein